MIELTEIGRFGKPHGIAGEISASIDVDPMELRCIFVNVDGIDVPFFISSARTKNRDTMLLKIDGYDTEQAVKMFVNKEIYALAEEIEEEDENDGTEGFYASDFVGYTAIDSDTGSTLGMVTAIDDNTANVLFIVESDERQAPLFIPVAEEFITDIDPVGKRISFSLPEGLITL